MGTVLIFVSLLTALLNFSVADTTRLEGNVPPPAATWVPEDFITMPGLFQKGDGAPVDTLDIGDSYLQIVLNDDYTWRYIKNRKKLEQEDVFGVIDAPNPLFCIDVGEVKDMDDEMVAACEECERDAENIEGQMDITDFPEVLP